MGIMMIRMPDMKLLNLFLEKFQEGFVDLTVYINTFNSSTTLTGIR